MIKPMPPIEPLPPEWALVLARRRAVNETLSDVRQPRWILIRAGELLEEEWVSQ